MKRSREFVCCWVHVVGSVYSCHTKFPRELSTKEKKNKKLKQKKKLPDDIDLLFLLVSIINICRYCLAIIHTCTTAVSLILFRFSFTSNLLSIDFCIDFVAFVKDTIHATEQKRQTKNKNKKKKANGAKNNFNYILT